MVPLHYYLILAAILFIIGMIGVLVRRNFLTVLMSIELMLNAVNINFVAFAHYMDSINGRIYVFFIMTVAAAEAAIGLAILISTYRNTGTTFVDEISSLKG
ncbi:MAG: NADH-quinone oxidoreductase subunit K [Nitrospirae bacterium RBG_19FT_COMBO_42_15]|nr:MAG: NADH-quinone oxidoreductase subunit K [Nitrospirae bacterium RBG_19FT_COMBO_42_15]